MISLPEVGVAAVDRLFLLVRGRVITQSSNGVDLCVARKKMSFKPGVNSDIVIQLVSLQFILRLLVVIHYLFRVRLMKRRHPRAE